MSLAVIVTSDVKVLGASEMLAKLVTGDAFAINPADVPSLTAMASGLGVDMAVAQAPRGVSRGSWNRMDSLKVACAALVTIALFTDYGVLHWIPALVV